MDKNDNNNQDPTNHFGSDLTVVSIQNTADTPTQYVSVDMTALEEQPVLKITPYPEDTDLPQSNLTKIDPHSPMTNQDSTNQDSKLMAKGSDQNINKSASKEQTTHNPEISKKDPTQAPGIMKNANYNGSTAIAGKVDPSKKVGSKLIISNNNFSSLIELSKNQDPNMTLSEFSSQLKKRAQQKSITTAQQIKPEQVQSTLKEDNTNNINEQQPQVQDSSSSNNVATPKQAVAQAEKASNTATLNQSDSSQVKSKVTVSAELQPSSNESVNSAPNSTEVDLQNITVTNNLDLENTKTDIAQSMAQTLTKPTETVASQKDDSLSSSSTIFMRTQQPVQEPKESPFSLRGNRALDNGQTVIISSSAPQRTTNISKSPNAHAKAEITPTFINYGNFDPNMSVADLMASGKSLYGDDLYDDELAHSEPMEPTSNEQNQIAQKTQAEPEVAQVQTQAQESVQTQAQEQVQTRAQAQDPVQTRVQAQVQETKSNFNAPVNNIESKQIQTKVNESVVQNSQPRNLNSNTYDHGYLNIGSATSDEQNQSLNQSSDTLAFAPSKDREIDGKLNHSLKADLKEELNTSLNLNLSTKEQELPRQHLNQNINSSNQAQVNVASNLDSMSNFDFAGIAGDVPAHLRQRDRGAEQLETPTENAPAQNNMGANGAYLNQYLDQHIDSEEQNQAEYEDDPNYNVGTKVENEPFYKTTNSPLYTNSDGEVSPYVCGIHARQVTPETINAMEQNQSVNQTDPMVNQNLNHGELKDNLNNYDQDLNQAPEQDDGPTYPGVYADTLIKRKKEEEALRNAQMQQQLQQQSMEQEQIAPNAHEQVQDLQKQALLNQEQMLNLQMEQQNQAFGEQMEQELVQDEISAGMDDGILAQGNSLHVATNAVRANTEEDQGPHYVVGHESMYEAPAPEEDDGPIYAVGPSSSNASVMANLNAIRNRRQKRKSYTPEQEYAYEQSLAQAARESHAAPQSEVIRRARELASNYANPDNIANGATEENYESFNNYYNNQEQALNNQGADPNLQNYQNDQLEQSANNVDQQELMEQNNNQLQSDDNLKDIREQNLQNQRQEQRGKYNFANMPTHENIGFGMAIFLYFRQLIASFFSHTTLSTLAPKLAMRLGPCYPSSMAIPFFFIGLIAGLLGSSFHSIERFDFGSGLTYLSYILMTGLASFRGIYRIFAYINRRRHDIFLMIASLTLPLLILIWLSLNFISGTNGIAEATIAMACSTMLSAAVASTLSWNMPQDPIDSCGTMSTKGLLFVIVLCIMVSFGLLNQIVGLSIIGVSIVIRFVFGYLFSKTHATIRRTYINALQLIILFAILFDLILLKSQNYELLSTSALHISNTVSMFFSSL